MQSCNNTSGFIATHVCEKYILWRWVNCSVSTKLILPTKVQNSFFAPDICKPADSIWPAYPPHILPWSLYTQLLPQGLPRNYSSLRLLGTLLVQCVLVTGLSGSDSEGLSSKSEVVLPFLPYLNPWILSKVQWMINLGANLSLSVLLCCWEQFVGPTATLVCVWEVCP